jgi:hypothetical protein
MKFIENLCPPALIYLIFMAIHVGLDLSLSHYISAVIKLVSGIVGVYLLDILCDIDLGIVSWAIVVTPFIIVSLATSISLGLGMDHLLQTQIKETFTTNTKSMPPADDLPQSSNAMY